MMDNTELTIGELCRAEMVLPLHSISQATTVTVIIAPKLENGETAPEDQWKKVTFWRRENGWLYQGKTLIQPIAHPDHNHMPVVFVQRATG